MAEQNSNPNQKRVKATTQQILGGNSVTRINPKWQQHYERLITLRDDLHQRKGSLSEVAKQEQPAFSLHMGDAGTDEFDRDFALSIISSDQSALYEIEDALNRIRNGSFGICEMTGKEIEGERLAAVPWARFSLEAQRELEANGNVSGPRLANRGSITEPAGDDDVEQDEAA